MKSSILFIMLMFCISGLAMAQADNEPSYAESGDNLPVFVKKAMRNSGISKVMSSVESWEVRDNVLFESSNSPSRAIFLEGVDSMGERLVSKIAVDSDNIYSLVGGTESCSGCSHCEFADGGGCSCKNWLEGTNCIHTITRQ